jgi:hypothetical protein
MSDATEAPLVKPCPFCGAPAKLHQFDGNAEVRCSARGCGIAGPGGYETDDVEGIASAIARWNERPAAPANQ